MARHNRIDIEQFEQDVYGQISRGNNTVALIAQALKIGKQSVKWRLDIMASEGKLSKKTLQQVCYYSRCELRAHDPFGLARKAA